MSISMEEIYKKSCEYFGDTARDVINLRIEEEVNMVLSVERKKEVSRATSALYSVKLSDEIIVRLLKDYWKINKVEAIEALRVEKTIKNPMRVIRTYMQQQGYTNVEIRSFLFENDVKAKLEAKSTLWKLSKSPAKLIKALKGDEEDMHY